jgi:hypothetical protein
VNANEFLKRFNSLGWQNGNDLAQQIANAGLPAPVVLAYLDALIVSPAGLNDQTIAGVSPAQGSAITNFLKNKTLVDT